MHRLGMTPSILYPHSSLLEITAYADCLRAFAPCLQAINGTPEIKEFTDETT